MNQCLLWSSDDLSQVALIWGSSFMSYIDLCESIQINLNKLYDTYEEVVDEFVFNKKPATVFVKDYILFSVIFSNFELCYKPIKV